MPTSSAPDRAAERRLVLLVAAVQFVNVLDFMMVMPLGPDFAAALAIPMSEIGIIAGSYTLAAAASGVLGSLFLDRFDRRIALGCAMAGLVLSTAAGGAATGLGSLVIARLVAGAFGGPATSIAIAAVSDSVPPQRRGVAMSAVMGAFAVASVLGVPAGLELARWLSWRAPFFAVAALGAIVTSTVMFVMPPLRQHLERRTAPLAGPASGQPDRESLLDRLSLLALSGTFITTLGVFLVVPNISAYFQHNLGYPRERLGLLYLVGGAASFVTLRITGRLVDRAGATRMVLVGSVLHAAALWFGFIRPSTGLPALVVFVTYMLSGSVRMVATGSLSTRVPRPQHRARFMSAQSAVQHTGSALGALLGSTILLADPSGRLSRMDAVAVGALLLALIVPLLASRIERGVREREREATRAGGLAPTHAG